VKNREAVCFVGLYPDKLNDEQNRLWDSLITQFKFKKCKSKQSSIENIKSTEKNKLIAY
jgi:hypothetical protein